MKIKIKLKLVCSTIGQVSLAMLDKIRAKFLSRSMKFTYVLRKCVISIINVQCQCEITVQAKVYSNILCSCCEINTRLY